MTLLPTAAQTVGPYLAIGLPWEDGPYAVEAGAAGSVRISGRLLDRDGEAVPDGMVETWQADPPAGAGFRGFARCPTDADGRWHVVTLPPGPVPGPGGAPQAPHLAVSVFARGLLHRLVTRLYFADHEEANAADPVLAAVPPARRDTLLAVPDGGGYRFDIRLQGPGETVFFDA
ncbi:MAG TPA: protocatechuate 3,4-dioxygenase subunit alpha [Solirubrobacteraceae bacterium]|nr:protocatechuate 3,4-dioxygenase subunit alpha [Solirubrobacteraceae bacterium]